MNTHREFLDTFPTDELVEYVTMMRRKAKYLPKTKRATWNERADTADAILAERGAK